MGRRYERKKLEQIKKKKLKNMIKVLIVHSGCVSACHHHKHYFSSHDYVENTKRLTQHKFNTKYSTQLKMQFLVVP